MDKKFSSIIKNCKDNKMLFFTVKRLFDVTLSSIALIMLSPIMLLVALAVKLENKGPVVFKQERFGKNKKPFTIYKFRTMNSDAPENCATKLIDSYEYITTLGKILRKTSLDELPQLINIVKGEMSIIGPRPVVLSEVKQIKEREVYKANDIKPGLTGWAQINGRDTLDEKEKAYYDGFYCKNLSIRMDIKIFFLTVIKVLQAKNIEPEVKIEVSVTEKEQSVA